MFDVSFPGAKFQRPLLLFEYLLIPWIFATKCFELEWLSEALSSASSKYRSSFVKQDPTYSSQMSALPSSWDREDCLARLPLTWACSCVTVLTVLSTFLSDQDLHVFWIARVASITLTRVSHTALQSYANLSNTHRRLISLRARNWLYARWMTDAARLLLDAPRRREQRQANAAILKSRSKTRPLSRRPAIDAAGFT